MGRTCVAAALCLLSVFLCSSATFETIYGLLHQNVSLPVRKPNGTTEIVCKFGGNKVFEWESDIPQAYVRQFSRRIEFKEESILIQELQKNDTGFYLLQFTLKNGTIKETNISLNVLVPLSMPTITCTGNVSIVYLRCNLNDHGSHVTTEWKRQNMTVILGDNFYLSNENKNLTISNPEEFLGEYTCIVKQPHNSKQSNPLLVQNCFEKKGNARSHVAVAPVIVFVIAFVSALVAVVIFRRKQIKSGIKNDDKGKHESVNIEENPEERDSQNSPVPTNVKSEDKVTPEASLDEPEKFREDSTDIDSPKDMEQAFLVSDGEQDGE